MSEVVELTTGGVIQRDRQPDTSIVEELEAMLERARAGEIIGIGFAYLHADLSVSTARAGVSTLALLGGMHATASLMADRLK